MYYAYLWMREDGTPYYVGKGSRNRAWTRRRIGNPPPAHRVVIIPCPSEDHAFAEEIRLIALHGRVDNGTGCLRNLTDGGENPPNHKGKKHGPEWGAKRSAALKGRSTGPQSEETKEKRRKAMLGRKFTPESIKKMRDAQIGKKHSEETKMKLSAIKKGVRLKPWSEETRISHEKSLEEQKVGRKVLSPLLESIGIRIFETRKIKGLTRKILADMASVHTTQIWAIETGAVNISTMNLYRIAKALDQTISSLLAGID